MTDERAVDIWQQAAQLLGGMAVDMSRQATQGRIVESDQLVVFFPAKYNSAKMFFERPENAVKLAALLADLVGRRLKIGYELEADSQTESADAPRPTSQRQRLAQVCQRPFVRQAIELFNATPQSVES